MRPPSTIGAIISVMLFGSVGLGLLTFAISSYKDGVGFKQKGIATIATVVKSEKDTDNDGDIFYHLNLRFLTRDGRTFEAIKNSANPSQDFPNNRGSIIYDSTNPGRVSVNSDLSNLEAGFWIFGGIGLFVAFTGFYSLLNYFSNQWCYLYTE